MALFDLLLTQIESVESGNRLAMANAVAHGQAMVEDGKNGEVKQLTRDLHARAYPARWIEIGG